MPYGSIDGWMDGVTSKTVVVKAFARGRAAEPKREQGARRTQAQVKVQGPKGKSKR